MKLGSLPLAALAALLAPPACGQVFVNENFDSYADTAALNSVWRPDAGDGGSPIGSAGELIPTTNTTDFPNGADNPPDLQGQGVGNFGAINEWGGSSFALLPSATDNIVVRGDIYVFDDGSVIGDSTLPSFGEPTNNTRQTIGLRNDTLDRDPTFGIQRGIHFLEMGFWNDSTCDPTVAGCDTGSSVTRVDREAAPGFRDLTQFGYRLAIFGGYGNMFENGVDRGPIVAVAPNWQYFQLDPALDLATTTLPNGNEGNGDGMVNITDVGSGWHTFQATLKAESILLELDLFRDGINNATGSAGVDASVEIEVAYATAPAIPGQQEAQPAPFTSLRIGGPSGVGSTTLDLSSTFPGVFDNLYLALEPNVVDPPDFPGDANGDGTVDLLDLDILGANFGTLTGATTETGDFNGDGAVDLLDLDILGANFGESAPAAAVPEPAALAAAALGLLAVARRR